MPEKMKEPSSARQKVTIGAVIVVIAIVIWQFKGLLGIGGGSSSDTIQPAPQPTSVKMTANAPQSMSPSSPKTPTVTTPTTTRGPMTSPPQDSQSAEMEVKQTSLIDTGITPEQRAATQKYIGKVNELEELKIQKDIAETNQAIATAKLATVTAEKSISDMLIKPSTSMAPSLPPGGYAAQMTAPIPSPTAIVTTPPPAPEMPPPLSDYTVISVTMQLNKWSAVIGYQGKLFSVSVGDTLPPDSSVVTKISRDAVILRRNGKIRRVPVVSSI